jgi:hypothetical protein
MSNNSNFNYLQTIPNEPSTTPSYQPTQQYQQQQFLPQQQLQLMGPNGKMINMPELDQAIMKFQQINPKYKFDVIRQFLPIKLDQHYKKYFDVLETIKQRRGQEEYLSDLRRLLNKMNDYITKTEQTIIKLKKTLDYTESTLPAQYQFQPTINGQPPVQNTFMIHELQNVIEKDNHIEFVDIFGLKGKNIAHIPPDDRMTILIVVQSLMGFVPPPSIIPTGNEKLMDCLNILKGQISDYSKEKVGDDDKLDIDIKNPIFKPLIKIDIYSKLFDIFDKGSINIKDLKTDKISERIESPSNRSSSQSSQSPYGFLRGGYEPPFGGPRRNNRKENNKNKKPQGNSKTNISGKIKKILKYELGSTDSGNKQFEIEKSVQKKGKEMTEYLFFSEEFTKELQDMRPNTYENSNKTEISNSNKPENNNQTGGAPSHSKGASQHKGHQHQQQKHKGKNKTTKLKNNEKFLLTGKKIIDYIKDTKEENSIKKEFMAANFDKFIDNIQDKYDKEIKPHIGIKNSGYSSSSLKSLSKRESNQISKQDKIRELDVKITNLKAETSKPSDYDKKLSDYEKEKEQIEIAYKYSVIKKDLEEFIKILNAKLKSKIEQYKYRIYKCGEESFNTLTKTVKDFFTGSNDKIKTKNEYRNRKNNEKKDITFIQMYMMMYEAYKEYYDKYSIETVIRSFTTDTIKSDNETKLNILNGLGLYSAIVYNKIKQVRDIIKTILQQSNPDFEKAKGMLLKVQTLLNSSPDEEKKEKLLKMKKNIEEQMNKLAENKKNNRGQNRKNTSGNRKSFNRGNDNKKPWEKKPYEKKQYSKYNND